MYRYSRLKGDKVKEFIDTRASEHMIRLCDHSVCVCVSIVDNKAKLSYVFVVAVQCYFLARTELNVHFLSFPLFPPFLNKVQSTSGRVRISWNSAETSRQWRLCSLSSALLLGVQVV